MSIAAVADQADTVTLLRAKGGKFLTKRWARFGSELQETSCDRAWRFSAAEHPVSDIHEVGALIQQISTDPRAAVVRGGIVEGANRSDMLRRARPREGTPATLETKSRWWLALDLDRISCPSSIDPLLEPDTTVEHAISHLPPAFHDVTSFWQFTGGHGIKPGIRLRLWYWLNRPISDEELRRWLGERVRQDGLPASKWPPRWPVDLALFNPIQLHYTAAPIFDGLPDPVPRRSGWHRGLEDSIVVPDLPRGGKRREPSSISRFCGDPGLGYGGWRNRIGDHVGGDGFFRPIKSAIGAYFAANGAHADVEWLLQDLTAVIWERQRDRPGAYIEDRLRDPTNAVAAIQNMQASREEAEAARTQQIARFDGDALGPLLIAERREDAEAGSKVTGFEAWACLAGFTRTSVDGAPIDRIIVVLLPDADRFSQTRRLMRTTIRHWQRQGRKVLQVIPQALSTGDGSTFADLLKEPGQR
jgi:hypothetical protein